MEILLMVAVVLTALAIIVQAGVLIGMYLISRRLTTKAETLMNESQKLMAPLESITNNLKTVSYDLNETGKMAREQMIHAQNFVSETQSNIRSQIDEIRDVVLDTVDEARGVIMKPVRQYSAIASAISVGVRTFFSGRKQKEEIEKPEIVATEIIVERKEPAA